MITAEQVLWMSAGAFVASVIVGTVAVVGYLVDRYLLTQPEGDTALDSWELTAT